MTKRKRMLAMPLIDAVRLGVQTGMALGLDLTEDERTQICDCDEAGARIAEEAIANVTTPEGLSDQQYEKLLADVRAILQRSVS